MPGVKASGQIGFSADVGMVEAKACWAWLKDDPLAAASGDEGCSFFGRPVYFCRHKLPMPVKLFKSVGVIVNINGYTLPFNKAQ